MRSRTPRPYATSGVFTLRPTLALPWSALVVRGVASLVLGIVALAWPGASLVVLALTFAAYSFVDGMLALVVAMHVRPRAPASFVLDGLLGIAAAFASLLLPGITTLGLAVVMGVRFALLGVLQIATAARLRGRLKSPGLHAAIGAASLFFALVTFAMSAADALVLLTMLAGFALGSGALQLALALRVRPPSPQTAPAPAHA